MKREKKNYGVERLKAKYGLRFCGIWIVGVILFFLYPLLQSVVYAFSDVKLEIGSMRSSFTGLDNFKEVLFIDPNYTANLTKSLTGFTYSFPLIMIISLILAMLLNQKFRGRTFFRALFFLPVIIAGGVVMSLISDVSAGSLFASGTDSSVREGMISTSTIVGWLGLNGSISSYVNTVVSKIMNLVWSCGVQIVLYISGMQSIPDLFYEVATVEGATAWERFWFVTFPSLSRVTVLVAVYTMIDIITSNSDIVMYQALATTQRQDYGQATAMIWFYFLIIGAIVGALLLCFNRFCLKRWS